MYDYSTLKLQLGPIPGEAVVTPGHRKKLDTRRLYHPKAGRVCETESYPEQRHLMYCAGNPNIIAYCSRPGPTIVDQVDGRRLIYTPDAWIRWDTGLEEIIEVKMTHDLVESEDGVFEPADWGRVKQWHADAGLRCRFITEELLDEHAVLIGNWSQLLPWVNRAIHENAIDVVDRVEEFFLARESGLLFGEVESHFVDTPPEIVHSALAYLLHQHRLQADLNTTHFSRSLLVSKS